MTGVNARNAEQPDIVASKRDFDDDDVETIAWGHGHWEYGGKAKRDESGAYAEQWLAHLSTPMSGWCIPSRMTFLVRLAVSFKSTKDNFFEGFVFGYGVYKWWITGSIQSASSRLNWIQTTVVTQSVMICMCVIISKPLWWIACISSTSPSMNGIFTLIIRITDIKIAGERSTIVIVSLMREYHRLKGWYTPQGAFQ